MLYRCEDCRSCFFDADEHDADLAATYEHLSVANGHTSRAFVRSPYWANEVASISALAQRPVKQVLDVGCRTGDLLCHWPESLRRVGVEISTEAAAVARQRGIEVVAQPLQEVDLQGRFGGGFDAVTCYFVLEHIPQPRDVLDALARSVAPGGVLAIALPTLESLKAQLLYQLRRPWHQFSPPEHFCFYSRHFLDSYFVDRGFALGDHKFTAGGMFNPLRGIPVGEKVFSRALSAVERHTRLTRYPVFDHMYRYYLRTS